MTNAIPRGGSAEQRLVEYFEAHPDAEISRVQMTQLFWVEDTTLTTPLRRLRNRGYLHKRMAGRTVLYFRSTHADPAAWRAERLGAHERLRQFFAACPDEELTVGDVAIKLGVSVGRARNVLSEMAGNGELERHSVYRLRGAA